MFLGSVNLGKKVSGLKFSEHMIEGMNEESGTFRSFLTDPYTSRGIVERLICSEESLRGEMFSVY